MDSRTGVLIVAYARNHEALNLANKSIQAGVSKLFIWIDGPKSANIQISQEKLCASLEAIKAENPDLSLVIYRSHNNFGASASVLAGTSLMFKEVEYGIVLEDDLQVDCDFFWALQACLKDSNKDRDVWMVTGTRLMDENTEASWEYINYPVAWGWGSTKEKWSEILDSIDDINLLSKIQNKKIKGFWKLGHRRAMQGKIDAWDVPLAGIMRALGKKCVIPPVNLVSNIGFDEHATHTKEESWPLGLTRKSIDVGNVIKFRDNTLTENNRYYEKSIYKIKLRHQFNGIYRWASDLLSNRNSARREPLMMRLSKASQLVEKINLQ